MRRFIEYAAVIVAPFVVAELWQAFRPDDLEAEIRDWFGTARGRFEQWYAEADRG